MNQISRSKLLIDAHVHMFPDRLFRAVRVALHESFDWKFAHGTNPGELAGYLRSQSVDRFFLLNYSHKPNMSAALNRWNREIADSFPQAISFAAIHPADDDISGVASQALDEYGLAGFKLHLDVLGLSADDPSLRPIYEAAQARSKPVIVHAGMGGSTRLSASDLSSKRLESVLRDFPGLKICVPHLGAPDSSSFFGLAERHANLWFDTTAALCPQGICFSPVDLDRLRRLSSRVMFGSDFPNLGHSWREEYQAVLDLGLDEEQLAGVLGGNALIFAGIST